MSPARTVSVVFMPGDGTHTAVDVMFISEFARGVDGTCAFCHGDPCAEHSAPDSPIAAFFERNRTWAETCPMCNGRPT